MTGVITIIFPGILQILCPTGMSCLPKFQPSLESLHEVWDLNLLVFCLLPHTRFCWMPMRVTGPSALNLTTSWTLSRGKHHEPSLIQQASACKGLPLYLPVPQATGLGIALPTSPWLRSAFVLKNPSLAARIAAGCSMPFTDPMLSVAALSCTRQLYKGNTPRTEQPELSLPFSHHLHTQGSQGRSCLSWGAALSAAAACAELPPSQTLKAVNLKTDE